VVQYFLHIKELQRVKHIPGDSYWSVLAFVFSKRANFFKHPEFQKENFKKYGSKWRITIGTRTFIFFT
jgi:hypothetical protein